MSIRLTEWLTTGLPSPLQWGASQHDFLRLWPSIQAEAEPSLYFDYGWLCRGLTNAQVQAALQVQGVTYRVDPGPAFQSPNLRTTSGVLFAFDSDFEIKADAELMKVYLGLPMPGMWSWQ